MMNIHQVYPKIHLNVLCIRIYRGNEVIRGPMGVNVRNVGVLAKHLVSRCFYYFSHILPRRVIPYYYITQSTHIMSRVQIMSTGG